MRGHHSLIEWAARACALALSFTTACDDAARPAEPPPNAGLVFITGAEESAGSTSPSSDDDGSTSGSSGSVESTDGSASTGPEPDPAPESTGDAGSTGSTGDSSSTGTSTGDGETDASTSGGSTGDEPPAPSVCGDGVCDESEAAAGCYKPGWCYGDCAAEPECLTECPCAPEADDGMNVCYLAPGACDATAPGGLCDPNGDGAYIDADWNVGFYMWLAKCAA